MPGKTILERAIESIGKRDTDYYLFYDMFKKWAEYEWTVPKDRLSMDHGRGHIERMLGIINDLLKNYTTNEIIEQLGEKYVVLLLVAIYSHDIGMQEYYYLRLPHLTKIHPHFLDKYNLKDIRKVHNDIIHDVFATLATDINKNKFIENEMNALQYVNPTSFRNINNLLKGWSIELAILTSFHNQRYSRKEAKHAITKSIESNKISLSSVDENKLVACIGLLQIADALDMTIERIGGSFQIGKSIGLDASDSIPEDTPEETIWKRFQCYLIDRITFVHTKEGIIAKIYSSYNSVKYEEHYELFSKLKPVYLERLSNSKEVDAVSMIRMVFTKFIFDVTVSEITLNARKDPLPEKVYIALKDWRDIDDDINTLLNNEMRKVFAEFQPSYIKIYSKQLDMFFGGIAVNFGGNTKTIERMCIRSDDLPTKGVEEKDDGDIILIEDTRRIIKNTSVEKRIQYHDYIKVVKNANSDLYIILKYQKHVIGLVNCHFTKKMNKDELYKEANRIKTAFSKLPSKIWTAHHKATERFHNILHLAGENMSEDIILFMKKLSRQTIGEGQLKLDIIDIYRLSITLNDKFKDIGCKNNIKKNQRAMIVRGDEMVIANVFEKVISELDEYTNVDIIIDMSKIGNYFVVKCIVYGWSMLRTGERAQLIYESLNNDWFVPEIGLERELGYPMIIKALLYYLGGKIVMLENTKKDSLEIHLCLPATRLL